MKAIAFTIAIALAASGAAADSPVYFPAAFTKPTVSCDFGAGETKPIEIVSDFESRWYSDQLAAAQEPSLYLESTRWKDGDGETLRFTWLRSFHAPVFVRVVGLGTQRPRLIAEQLSGKGGYEPGAISERLERPLSPSEAEAVELTLSKTKVLTAPPKLCDIGLDGAAWIIEGVDAGGYHFVVRWSPERGEVHDVGLKLLSLTGWKLKPIY